MNTHHKRKMFSQDLGLIPPLPRPSLIRDSLKTNACSPGGGGGGNRELSHPCAHINTEAAQREGEYSRSCETYASEIVPANVWIVAFFWWNLRAETRIAETCTHERFCSKTARVRETNQRKMYACKYLAKLFRCVRSIAMFLALRYWLCVSH